MTEQQAVCKIDNGIAVITMQRLPLNALGEQLRNQLLAHIEACEANPDVKAIVLASACPIFSAGADITEFKTGFKGASLAAIQDALEQSQKITVALINQKALGGAAEIAVACHYRICDANASIGFPEVSIGLIPGAGGTQRLPRLIDFSEALQMIISGKSLKAQAALKLGLVDEVVEGDLMVDGLRAVTLLVNSGTHPRPTCMEAVKVAKPDTNWAELAKPWISQSAKRVGAVAPNACFEALMNALTTDFKKGLELEQALFFKAILSQEAQALQYAFFAQRQVMKVASAGDEALWVSPKSIGVVGAGLMGTGIAMAFANAGYNVKIHDLNQAQLKKSSEQVKAYYESQIKKGRVPQQKGAALASAVEHVVSFEELKDCDLVIEAVFENLALKQDIFKRLNDLCPRSTILASNTSALDINEIAKVVDHPERVIGLHFFSPAQITHLLEVVRAEKTSPTVIKHMLYLAKSIKKTPVVVKVCPGFVGNRLMFKYLKQANDLVCEGASPYQIDQVIQRFGFPMGPFLMCDMVGLDLAWVKPEKPHDVRDVMCLNGRLGQKVKAGYYDYPEDVRHPEPSQKAMELIDAFIDEHGIQPNPVSDEMILERCIYALINEGFKVLEEGVVDSPSAIDVIYLFGYGFPAYRGGPMYYAEQVGLANVLQKIESFKANYGSFWEPAASLKKMVAEKTRLKDWAKVIAQE